jgi:uncharacterized protein (TIGR02266 family)
MRAQPRIDFETDVQLDGDGVTLTGRTADLSQGGTFVAVEQALPVGARVELSIRLPGVRGVCHIPSIVRWSRVDRGIGLQFERLRPIEVWAINRIVRSTARSA